MPINEISQTLLFFFNKYLHCLGLFPLKAFFASFLHLLSFSPSCFVDGSTLFRHFHFALNSSFILMLLHFLSFRCGDILIFISVSVVSSYFCIGFVSPPLLSYLSLSSILILIHCHCFVLTHLPFIHTCFSSFLFSHSCGVLVLILHPFVFLLRPSVCLPVRLSTCLPVPV